MKNNQCAHRPTGRQYWLSLPLLLSPFYAIADSNPCNTASADTCKPVIYQVFTRLFGNTETRNKPWGTLEENGVGKFSDFDDIALNSIHQLGVSHIWYTGIPHHAVINDYQDYGISLDDPDVVKGRAGSPYAVKDYYNVNPDLADDPAKRLEEFQALIARTHAHNMKVIIDIVPNHVARNYQSINAPKGTIDFGQQDNTRVEYAKHNDFYYIPDTAFEVPDLPANQPLGGQAHPLSDGHFDERPAKWTGNGSRLAKPSANDWYETVKVNYGVKPNGEHDFPALPADYANKDWQAHYQFWQQVPAAQIPASWHKFKAITLYWLAKGVDGFRYDMAEMVPVEFWSYLNSHIKQANPNALLLAEVYTPSLYRDYIYLGKMDYLYDKVGLYDSLKAIIQGKQTTAQIAKDQANVADIAPHMLNFLENHDEQRIASPEFAGSANNALPALVVSSLLSSSPTLIYFGQEVGEAGAQNAGFGQPSRTSIFDYIGVPAHQRFMNGGKFDGGQSAKQEMALRQYYATLLNLSHTQPALLGDYVDLHSTNIDSQGYDNQVFAFGRSSKQQQMVVVSNFSQHQHKQFTLKLTPAFSQYWTNKDADAQIKLVDKLADNQQVSVIKQADGYQLKVSLAPLQSQVWVTSPLKYQILLDR
ncbi:alpha-amylase family protein [Shewanella waksmanii]|uniref:alpha-amylase family protein n=1 Tax=Shewanella waksmanii TaxID=213783 RepID=UPI0004AE9026|nr:alpha-amylase family protein [Shewanella waksmanii]